MSYTKRLEEEMSAWPNLSAHPHRFAAREFLFGDAELGHVHMGGMVDVPFPRAIRDALLEHRLAEEHRRVPNSGWITFRMHSEQDQHALWLMRLSYLRYALKTASDPRKLLDQESDRLRLNPRFRDLLGQFVPRKAESAA